MPRPAHPWFWCHGARDGRSAWTVHNATPSKLGLGRTCRSAVVPLLPAPLRSLQPSHPRIPPMTTSTLQQILRLADPGTAADLRTYVTRARTADDGAIRLSAHGTVLAAYVAVLRPKLLGEGTPTVLGLRTMALAESADVDVTVPLSAVADRLARM